VMDSGQKVADGPRQSVLDALNAGKVQAPASRQADTATN
jgi:hypothetical protein